MRVNKTSKNSLNFEIIYIFLPTYVLKKSRWYYMLDNTLDELLNWVMGADRRQILMESMRERDIVKAADIAHETWRSTQNISRAMKELEARGLMECLTPEKNTWRKYILTDMGEKVLEKMEERNF